MREAYLSKRRSPSSSREHDEHGKDVPQSYIRLPDYEKSIRA